MSSKVNITGEGGSDFCETDRQKSCIGFKKSYWREKLYWLICKGFVELFGGVGKLDERKSCIGSYVKVLSSLAGLSLASRSDPIVSSMARGLCGARVAKLARYL